MASSHGSVSREQMVTAQRRHPRQLGSVATLGSMHCDWDMRSDCGMARTGQKSGESGERKRIKMNFFSKETQLCSSFTGRMLMMCSVVSPCCPQE